MNFSKSVSNLITNKYFLYFMVFLAVTNILGYLVTNKLNAAIFFGLVGLLTYQFSKNMAIVLLVAILATNFLMAKGMRIEGMENATESVPSTSTDPSTSSAPSSTDKPYSPMSKLSDVDPTSAAAADLLKNSSTAQEAKDKLSSTVSSSVGGMSDTTSSDEPEGAGQTISGAKANMNGTKKPYIDNAATMSEAYENLQKMIGEDGLKKMTDETKGLMQQQQELFKSMEQMRPSLESAMQMLQGIDMKQLSGLAGLASSFNMPTQQKV